jgi:hypothetical protein
MLTALYSPVSKELIIRLGEGESEERLRLLGVLLQKFLDRNLREIGTAITGAIASKKKVPPPLSGVAHTP